MAVDGRRIDGALRRLRREASRHRIGPDDLTGVINAWGNRGFAPDRQFLAEVIDRASSVRGAVLECGTGLSTLLLGLFAPAGSRVLALEHMPEWADKVDARLGKCGLASVHVHRAPLRAYPSGHAWYDVNGLDLPEQFALVVCDGPPSETPGGRYGLFDVVGERLTSGTTILLHDAERDNEQTVLRRWSEDRALEYELRPGSRGEYAVVTVG